MRTLRIHHIDSFTQTIFSGNPTATVMNASILTDNEMKTIAREMNLSETGFILPSQQGDLRLRYFTPNGSEIKFCGHATLGALHSICIDKLYGTEKPGRHTLHIETNAGLFPFTIDNSENEKPEYEMRLPDVTLETPNFSLKDVSKALGIPDSLIDLDFPVCIDKNQNYVYFKASSLKALKEFSINLQTAIEFAAKHKIIVFCALVPETFNNKNHVHSRGFAPWVGVPEDPFTGSMQGGIAAYLVENDLLSDSNNFIGLEQGHFLERPGEAQIKILGTNPFQTLLKASATHVFTFEIKL